MTATVAEFCRVYGLNKKSSDLVEQIFEALIGGAADKHGGGNADAGAEGKLAVSDGDPREAP